MCVICLLHIIFCSLLFLFTVFQFNLHKRKNWSQFQIQSFFHIFFYLSSLVTRSFECARINFCINISFIYLYLCIYIHMCYKYTLFRRLDVYMLLLYFAVRLEWHREWKYACAHQWTHSHVAMAMLLLCPFLDIYIYNIFMWICWIYSHYYHFSIIWKILCIFIFWKCEQIW